MGPGRPALGRSVLVLLLVLRRRRSGLSRGAGAVAVVRNDAGAPALTLEDRDGVAMELVLDGAGDIGEGHPWILDDGPIPRGPMRRAFGVMGTGSVTTRRPVAYRGAPTTRRRQVDYAPLRRSEKGAAAVRGSYDRATIFAAIRADFRAMGPYFLAATAVRPAATAKRRVCFSRFLSRW